MSCYILKYDILKVETLPPAWDGRKKRWTKGGTKMATLGNPRIEQIPKGEK